MSQRKPVMPVMPIKATKTLKTSKSMKAPKENESVVKDLTSLMTVLLKSPVVTRRLSLANTSLDIQTQSHDMLFNLLKKVLHTANGDKVEVICMGRFWKILEQTGIRRSDPRLKDMVKNMNHIKSEKFDNLPLESIELNRDQFKRVVGDNMGLLLKAFKNQFVIPEFDTFCKQIGAIYNRCKDNNGGELASYIPELTRK